MIWKSVPGLLVLAAAVLLVACGSQSVPEESQPSDAPDVTVEDSSTENRSDVSSPNEPEADQGNPVGEATNVGTQTESQPAIAVEEAKPTSPGMVDVQIGQAYSAGTRVNFPSVGVSFAVPDEWIGQVPQGAQAFVMASTTKQGLVIATSHQSTQSDDLAVQFQEPIALDQGVVLTLQQPAQVSGSQISAPVTVSDGVNNFPGYLVGLVRDSGGGVVFIGFGGESLDYYRALVGETVGTFQDTEVKSAADLSTSEGAGSGAQSSDVEEWDQFLRGKKLTYLESYSSSSAGGGGFSSQREYYLCRDGRFEYGDSSSISGGDFGSFTGGNPASSGQGRWEIISEGSLVGLQLNWNDGSTSAYRLDFEDNKTYLDGERHFVTDDNPFC